MTKQAPNIQGIYPLTPTQQGILFHTLLETEPGVYVVQAVFTLGGEIQAPVLKRAWEHVLDRYEVLRSLFVWKGEERPLQVVRQKVVLPWEQLDWRDLSDSQQRSELESFLRADRKRGFDLSTAPLMRLALIRVADGRYELIWTTHHLLLDGWSTFLVISDVAATYRAFCRQRDPQLPHTRPYRDYVSWLQRQDASKGEAFWRGELEGFDTPTPFGVDRRAAPRLAHDDEIAYEEQRWPSELSRRLTAFGARHNLTTSTLMHGVWAVLLSRYSGEPDVLFGSVVSGRPAALAGVESMVGLFINTLPALARVSPAATVGAWLQDFQRQLLALREYEHSSLVDIQGWSGVRRDQPLFESLLVFENYPIASSSRGEGDLNVLSVRGVEQTNYPLTLTITPGEELLIKIAYNTGRFDRTTMTRLLSHFRVLLEGMISNPDARIATLPMLTEMERQQVLVEWNATAVPPVRLKPDTTYVASAFRRTLLDPIPGACVHQLVEEQAQRAPNRVAVVFEGQSLTYGELNRRANQLARHMRALGVGPDILVGLFVERSLDMLVGIIGILKAGGAYVPMDPEYPRERLRYILEDSQTSIVLTQRSRVADLPAFAGQSICLDGDWAAIACEPEDNLGVQVKPEHLAYVLFTSGSTGRPKGVMVEHGSVVNFLRSMQERPGCTAADVLVAVTTVSFDIAALELFLPLVTGARLVIARSDEVVDGARLQDLLARSGATILQATPATWKLLLEAGWTPRPPLTMLCGGEALPRELATRLLVHGGALWNMYGPTETTIWSAVDRVAPGAGPVLIGPPIANTQIYVVDRERQPVPIGVAGEVVIGGAGVARGYLHRPELTAERFGPNPFRDGRVYHTGDLARFHADGRLEFLGRRDGQVKLRGYRIELGEIEAVLTRHAGVADAVVQIWQPPGGESQLVAYYIAAGEPGPSADTLRAELQATLPPYMIPARFIALAAFPLTPNGKIDRTAFPSPEAVRGEDAGAVAPQGELERQLVGLWEHALHTSPIGVTDNFFARGGHSLLAAQLVGRIERQLGVKLPLATLFDAPTIRQLAARIADRLAEPHARVRQVEIPPRPDPASAPLSSAQRQMWLIDQMTPGNPAYILSAAYRLCGALDVSALEASVNDVIRRHEVLRTSFANGEDEPVQHIHPALTIRIPVTELGPQTDAHAERRLQALLAETSARPFDLSQLPLIRVSLFRLGATDHVLLLNIQHIVADGLSIGVLLREVDRGYREWTGGAAPPAPRLPVQYADYAAWQRSTLANEAVGRPQIDFWRQRLSGRLPVLDLPADKPRPPVQSFRGSNVYFTVPAGLTRQLKALGAREACTSFMTLLAAFQLLLHRYAGADDLVIGTPVATRTHRDVEPLIGNFLNMTALRCDLADNPTFRELLRRTRETAVSAFSNSDVPFEALMPHLSFERDPSRNPIFQAMLELQSPSAPTLSDLDVQSLPINLPIAQVDVSLHVNDQADGFVARFEYCADLFEPATIERLAASFVQLLDAVVQHPDQRIAQVPLLAPADRQQILTAWNDTARPYPTDRGVPHLVEQMALRAPQRVAAQFDRQTLTYGALNARANRLAHYLGKAGVTPGSCVGLCVERSLDLVVGLLGILKAGAAYVPLDPTFPRDRLAYMVDDARVAVLVTQASLRGDLPPGPQTVISLDADWDTIQREPDDAPQIPLQPSDLAYVIYTSGSTGQPKGVMVEHGSVVNFLRSMQERPGCTAADVLVAVTTVSFDIAALELFLPLVTGARLVIARSDEVVDGARLQDLLARSGATILQATPATWKLLLEAGWTPRPPLTMLCGGEALPRELATRLLAHGGALWNMYGPTETTIWSAVDRVAPGAGPVLIGPPIANTQIYVVDRERQPVPIGVAGEVVIGGAGVARGYLHRPELTAERFGPNPFRDGRVYHTGDLARFHADGRLEFLGRRDGQVKLRGYRIELGEIEAVLTRHAGVADAVVQIWQPPGGESQLVAYYIAAGEPGPSADALRAELQATLPPYMIPARFIALAAFPLTPNGKIDRTAFPSPEAVRGEDAGAVAPQGELERQLVGLWERALHTSPIGVTDNFFARGGHSLLAAQLVGRIERQLGVKLPLATLFDAPTIRQLAARIADRLAEPHARVRQVEIPPRPDPASAPLSSAQRQMWLIDQMTPGNPAYILSAAYRLRGALDVSALEASVNDVIRRHEVLRTSFAIGEDEPVQHIHPALTIRIPVTELGPQTDAHAERRLQALLAETSARPFDLSQLPLIRVSLFRLGATDHVLLLNIQHIVADGLSIGVLLREVDRGYREWTGGAAPPAPRLPVQYADYAAWQRSTLANEAVGRPQIDFWRQRLSGRLPVLDLPADKPRPPVQSFRGSNVYFTVPAGLTRQLKALGAREACTSFMTLLAAFQLLLHRYAGADDLVIGTPVATRTHRDVEPLIGNFLNMTALRCDLADNPTFRELLRRTRETAVSAFSNSDVPFEALMPHLSFERDPSRNPVFQVMLEVQSAAAPALGDLDVQSFNINLDMAQVDLSLHVNDQESGYVGRFEYCSDLFEPATIERLAASFVQLLEGVVTQSDQRISTVPLLTPSERQILTAWNDTSREGAPDRCVHHLVEQMAGRAANRVAVQYDGETLTYGALNARANRLAHYLGKAGVTPGSCVGLCVERSLDLVVGLLGILKAGAAYVPLDPTFPRDRLAYMVDDARVAVLVTQASLRGDLPPGPQTVISLDADWDTIQREPDDAPQIPLQPSDLAYVIYTSGSTGQPKGVMVEHGSVVNFLRSMQERPGCTAADVLVAVTTVSFDIAALELFLPLVTGARLVIARSDEVVDGARLQDLLARSGATILQATPATWKLLLEAGWTPRPPLTMLCGGEALPRELATRLLAHGGALWNMYGPTETTIWSAVDRVAPGAGPVLIGPPIANTQIYVVDRERQPVPIGVAGEVVIGGAGVARGYLHRPQLTAERFGPNPFRDGRVYHTGDLARFHADGRLEFLGRRDDQVKLRGYRIELGEIEAVLIAQPGIKDAAAVLWQDRHGDTRLVAYYVPTGAPLPATKLRAALQEKLPHYMIPSRFMAMEAFPLTANGKIDRRSLPTPDAVRFDVETRAVAPHGELEVQLAALWERTLNKHPISASDNFFELGGHSLLAAQLFTRIERQFGVKLPLALLFQAPTIRQLAEKIQLKDWTASWKSLVPIQPLGARPPLFVIHAAEGNVLRYRHLARRLGSDQPVYGLQSRGLDGLEPMETTIEGMAGQYLAEIRSLQPNGPYYLSGYCLGGMIALEIAQRLRHEGESVALLAMFETYNRRNEPLPDRGLHAIHIAQHVYYQGSNLALSVSGGTFAFFAEKVKFEMSRLKVHADVVYSRRLGARTGRRPTYPHLQVRMGNEQAALAYRPRPYDGVITLFKPRTHYRGFNDPCFGWQDIAGQGVRLIELPNCPRGSLNDPFVGVVADALMAEIDRTLYVPTEATPGDPRALRRVLA